MLLCNICSNRNCRKKCIAYSKTFYTDLVPVYKIKSVQGTVIDGLTADPSFEMILSIEPMPQYTLSLDVMDCDDNISPIYPLGGHRYETLGILDNGIANIPQLQPWMDGNRWTVYPESVIDATHGTLLLVLHFMAIFWKIKIGSDIEE